ncbi:MAG: cytochrome P450, partial [Rhizobacter sp.]|nr:cytochrome P450 [Rhizobacter sp.]
GAVFGGLMRQNDGPAHARGKAWATAVLQGPGPAWPVADTARAVVAAGASPRQHGLDALLFDAPLQVLWRLLHEGRAAPAAFAAQVRTLVAGWSPSSEAAGREAASQAASTLLPLLGGEANRVGLYTQTCEATAGLMGAVLVALQREPGLRERWLADPTLDEALALETARHDAPVQNTRRFAAEPCRLRGHAVNAGDAVLVLLASANRDPAANPEPDRFDVCRTAPRNFTWGLGGHACPGAALSRQIAMALLRAWHDDDGPGLAASTRRWQYRPSPNGRLARFGEPAA